MCANISEIQMEVQNRPEVKEAKSEAIEKYWEDLKAHKRHSRLMTEVMNGPEVKKRNSEAQIKVWADPDYYAGRTGENNPLWKGGPQTYGWGWGDIRYFIKVRDYFTCQECGTKENLRVHHIDYNVDNMADTNLITLCISCNARANFDREYWQDHFQEMIRGIPNSMERRKVEIPFLLEG